MGNMSCRCALWWSLVWDTVLSFELILDAEMESYVYRVLVSSAYLSQVILFGVIPSTSVVALETSTIAPVISSVAWPVSIISPLNHLFHHLMQPILLRLPDSSDVPSSQTHMVAIVARLEEQDQAGEDSSDSSGTRDGIVKSFEDMPINLGNVVHDFYHHMSEADQLIASGDRARMAERIYSLRLENLKVRAMLDIERDHVSSLRLHMSLSQEEFCQIRRDRDDAQGRLRRLEPYLERNEIQKMETELWNLIVKNNDLTAYTQRFSQEFDH
ncbi:hypothetical protein Tco_1153663 [Tanacetum coccineum]